MQTIEQVRNSATGLYRLLFLLTGKRSLSLDLTLEFLRSQDGPAPAVAKALASVHEDLVLSAAQVALKKFEITELPPGGWSLDPDTTKVQIEKALLDIDIFPRCALVLTMFEGLSLDETSALLDADRGLVLQARTCGLLGLTRNLARPSSGVHEYRFKIQAAAV